jgi:sec-independent protein translocase protein TatA
MGRGLFEGWHLVILLVLVVVLFGARRLPDAARSIGRSMRIFKSEMGEMKNEGKSAASSDTVKGETVRDTDARAETRTQGEAEGTSAVREDHSPRTDNTSGAA